MAFLLLLCLFSGSVSFAADNKPPTIPSGLQVTGVTTSSVSLQWKASRDLAGGSGLANYDVFRNGAPLATVATTSFTDSNLSAATTYVYAVRARDNAGNVSGLSSTVSATTLGAPSTCSTLPATPTNLTAPSKTSTTVTLSWTASPAAPNCTLTYNVFRNGVAIASAIPTPAFTAGGLSPATTYSFSVSATNQLGSSSPTSPINVTTDPDSPPPSSGFPTRLFAPYIDMLLWPTPSLPTIAASSGSPFFTLAFIVSKNGCQASWGGYYLMSDNFLVNDIAALRNQGGNVIVSFGGAAGIELAQACSTVSALQAQYQSVIDKYGLSRLDFDIEGAALGDAASIDRRNKAIAGLQAAARAAGRTLVVQYTLPVAVTGLTTGGTSLLQNAIANGVDIGLVNVMAMDYGGSANPYTMGQNAINAANATFNQLQSLYGGSKTAAQLRSMQAITPMIGLNDVTPEVFTLTDASMLLSSAQQNGIGMLAMWSSGRDQSCPNGAAIVSATCSGIAQAPYAFTQTFRTFNVY